MKQLVFKQRSRKDLFEIFDFIARDKPQAAANFVEELITTCEQLRVNPELGMRREELAENLRMFVYRTYGIYYLYEADSSLITIVRVLHHSLDVTQQKFD